MTKKKKKKEDPGIYLIKNKITKMVYVGQTGDLKIRMNCHKWELRNNKHGNPRLQASWNTHGAENFEFSVLERCDRRYLTAFEIKYYQYYKSLPAGVYNVLFPGDAAEHSLTAKEKQSLRQTGVVMKYKPGVYEKKADLLRSFNEARKGKPGKLPTEEDKRKAWEGQMKAFPDAYRITNNFTGQSWIFLSQKQLEDVTGLTASCLLKYSGKIPKEIVAYRNTLIWSIEKIPKSSLDLSEFF